MKHFRAYATIVIALLLLAASLAVSYHPARAETPPPELTPTATVAQVFVTNTPVPVTPPASGFSDIIPLLVTALITALAAAVGWLGYQLQQLKRRGSELISGTIPLDWQWIAKEEASILVRAAYQKFPLSDTQAMFKYAQDGIYAALKASGIPVSDEQKKKIADIIYAAVADFYIELGKPELVSF